MKQLKIFFLGIVFLLIIILAYPQVPPRNEILPEDFSTKAFNHIIYLSRLGHRQAGTENDRLAIQYIRDQFENIGLHVEIQPFEFESFEYTHVGLAVGERRYEVIGLGFDPYNDKREYEGQALLFDPSDSEKTHTPEEIEGKTVITNDWQSHFRLLRLKPSLIIYVGTVSFEEMKSRREFTFKLNVEGQYKKHSSANIIGTVGNKKTSAKEFLITAHFDTYRKNNPGASDNASGIGVLLELARYFKKMEGELGCIVRFVAFGAEEIGIVGARNYLYNNSESLRRCELLFNMDDVGGEGKARIEMTGGVSGIPDTKCVSQIPERIKLYPWEGVESYWRMLPDSDLLRIFSASNHPGWLVDIINKSVEELGYDIQSTGTQGSDQLAFAQAGIVTSGIGISSEFSHTPQDIPDNINKKSLKMAGEITAHVVLNAIKRFM